ncbi:MAG: hypothetical protein H6597_00150 [Flavobacteriales bacterium]|nr:hypothetical protein [Flavobacteriales bacterium]
MSGALVMMLLTALVHAGNPGPGCEVPPMTQLLIINPGRSNGWGHEHGDLERASKGCSANIAGLAHTQKTGILFTTTRWLEGSGVKINAIGPGRSCKSAGATNSSVMNRVLRDLTISTTVNLKVDW